MENLYLIINKLFKMILNNLLTINVIFQTIQKVIFSTIYLIYEIL